ncbi:carboxymuconolactone decarboxylase family protein [Aquimarina sp. U1-2]|uniref:carboxymuconolactone decarboxylase family protein n=1 Tax=Aquimarina sp. U1-2 TaxID=2823141 RepID=UPI001AEC776E|nr:carboxymuconolactone decarboxylase family protein [Aquimarina sp. U1-2]MBP2831512.1 carboxymuconolactone decarboxylase family protein [Aquimarina sp. U1-2]
MSTFNVPTRDEVSETNKALFDNLEKTVGFVPNLFATYAYSNNALKNYLEFSNAKTSLKAKEKEVINLAVSQVNNCEYCLAAHTAIAKLNGFTEDQILELRAGEASFDSKLDALAKLARNITENRGNTDSEVLETFFNAGWTKEHLIDTISLVGDKTISNYINNTTKIPVDFPEVTPLEVVQ